MAFLDKSMLFEAANSSDIPQVTSTGGGGKYSISVVNSDGNGKRITLSKALIQRLGLEGSVSLLPLKDHGVLMLAKELPFARASTIQLNSKDGRIAYNADAVHLVVTTFALDYSNGRTSLSFNDIEFMEEDGMEIAVVHMPTPTAGTGGEGAA